MRKTVADLMNRTQRLFLPLVSDQHTAILHTYDDLPDSLRCFRFSTARAHCINTLSIAIHSLIRSVCPIRPIIFIGHMILSGLLEQVIIFRDILFVDYIVPSSRSGCTRWRPVVARRDGRAHCTRRVRGARMGGRVVSIPRGHARW